MRFDVPVFFQRIEHGEYDVSTGNYGPDKTTEVKKYASVSDAGIETLNLVYGKIRQGCKVVRFQTHYNQSFDRILIENKAYRVDFQRKLRTKHIFVVSEVQGSGKNHVGRVR